jgi:hypothetical protein
VGRLLSRYTLVSTAMSSRLSSILRLFPWGSRRFAPFREGFRRRGASGRYNEKLRNGNAESLCEAVQKIDGGIFSLPLKASNICAIDVRIVGEPLLRNPALNADPSQIPGHERASFHARRQPVERPLNHWI